MPSNIVTQYFPRSWTVYNVATGAIESQGSDNYSAVTKRDVIKSSNSGKRRFNSCAHTALTADYRIIDTKLQQLYSGSWRTRQDCWNYSMAYSSFNAESVAWRTPAEEQAPVGFVGRAFDKLWPDVDAEVNLVNFLLELRDFKRTFTSLRDTIAFIFSGRFATALAEANLNWSFGVSPFMGDIQKLVSSYSDFRKKVNELNQASGSTKTHHYSEEVSYAALTVTNLTSATSKYQTRYEPFVKKWTCTIKYTMKLRIPYPPTFQNYAKSLGFKFSLETIWNAIPFSFVLDWVVKIGDWLSRFDEKVPADITILDCCVSRKAEEVAIADWLAGTNVTTQRYSPYCPSWARYTLKSYYRSVIFPDVLSSSVSLPRLDNLSLRELGLSLSLLWRR